MPKITRKPKDGFRSRVVELKHVRADEIVNASWNYRRHPEEQKRALEGSIKELGFFDPLDVFVDGAGQYVLIDGEARTDIVNATIGPDTMVPVNVTDLNEREAKAALAVKDQLASLAGSDNEALADLLREVESSYPLREMGWPEHLLEPLLAAEWKPPAIEDFEETGAGGRTLSFTAEQWETIEAAIEKYQENNEQEEIGNTQAIELICSKYLHD